MLVICDVDKTRTTCCLFDAVAKLAACMMQRGSTHGKYTLEVVVTEVVAEEVHRVLVQQCVQHMCMHIIHESTVHEVKLQS